MEDVTGIPILSLMSFGGRTRTKVLVASDWKFPLTTDSAIELVPLSYSLPDHHLSFPTLSGLLDALIESLLHGPSDDARLLAHSAVQYSYLYGHVPALRDRSFAAQLKHERRQFHYDILLGMEPGTLPFRKHQLEVREAILRGEFELQECSVHRNHDLLVDVWANVRKGLPEPPLDETTE
ncbi:hypothetical protein BDV19DRAFT_170902 [Aspergillus venezuelensis]